MADMTRIKGRIAETIYPNGTGAITAESHQVLLLEMVDDINTKKADQSELVATQESLDALEQKVDNLPQGGGDVKADGVYPDLTAGDLIGRGESVPAEYTFRASGGKSIKDGRAYIKRIKGNSVVWNQLYKPIDAVIRTQIMNGVTFSVYEDGTIEANGTAEGGSAYITLMQYTNFLASHKYILIAIGAPVGKWTNQGFYFTGVSGINTSSMIGAEGYKIFQPSADGESGLNLTCWSGYSLSCKFRPMFVDLTKAFPNDWQNINTIEDFNARVATLGIEDMNAYNEGEVIHCNTESIKSVGDNAWDEEWELGNLSVETGGNIATSLRIRTKDYIQVIGGESYVITMGNASRYSDVGTICYYDNDKRFISATYPGVLVPFTIPANAKYIRIGFISTYGTTYKNDIMITLVHSGWKQDTDAGYQPYWQDTLPLPIIRKYFPDGMKSAGTAHDEIRYNKATQKWEMVQRIGGVKMKNLTWAYNTQGYFSATNLIDSIVTPPNWKAIGNILVRNYDITYADAIAEEGIQLQNMHIAVAPNGRVYLSNNAYTAGADLINSFTDDDILYYELAEPIVTELDAEDQNFRDYYQVADFGTEMSQSNNVPSAAFSADIIYQFNAVDMIREHELEITELQNIIATMQAQLASLTNS